jgi:ABC-type antimicrobial peptide transport system permease subunit
VIYMGIANRAFRSVWRKWARSLIVILALGLSIAMIVSMNIGITASENKTTDMINNYKIRLDEMNKTAQASALQISVVNFEGMNFNFTRPPGDFPGNFSGRPPSGGGGFPGSGGDDGGGGFFLGGMSGSPITMDAVTTIGALENVSVVIPKVSKSFGSDRRNPDYTVNGVILNATLDAKYNILPSDIIAGHAISATDPDEVMINQDLKDFFEAGVGDTITVQGVNMKVAGIYASSLDRKGIYMSLENARPIASLNSENVSSLTVYATNATVVDSVTAEIQDLYPNYRATSVSEMMTRQSERMTQMEEEQVTQLNSDLSDIQSRGNQLILVSGATAGLIVLFIMTYTVRERIKEIGTLKALGFKGYNIMTQLLLEGMIIGFFGGVLGILIAQVATPFFTSVLLPNTQAYATASPSAQLILTVLGLTVALGALGSLYPAWSASRKRPAEAMKNE